MCARFHWLTRWGLLPRKMLPHVYDAAKAAVAGVEIGVHLHSRPIALPKKFSPHMRRDAAALTARLRDLAAVPLLDDELIGNIPTEAILTTLAARGISTGIDTKSLAIACAITGDLREKYTHTEPKPQNQTSWLAKLKM